MFELLRGVKVVDLTTVVLGPYATQILGDLGAEVIKVEPPEGDVFRAVRPGRSPRMGAGYLNCNRNKRSIVIDLKQAEGRQVLKELVRDADVVVHNMRPQAAAKLGAGYEDLRANNPELVYCYAPGFGQGGPLANAPAYDDIIQARSGIAQLNADASGAPRFLPTIVCDKVGGLHLALAVLAGLTHRARTGKGSQIEAPMYEGIVSFLMAEQLSGESFLPPLGGTGYARLQAPNRKPFRTRDGYITLLPYTSRNWSDFLKAVDRHDLAEADWVLDAARRSDRIDELYQVVAAVTPTRSTDEWLELLRQLDIPSTRLNGLGDLLHDEHLLATGFFREFDHPSEGRLRSVGMPFRVIGGDVRDDLPAPELGRNSVAIMREAGLDDAQIARLLESGVVRDDGARP